MQETRLVLTRMPTHSAARREPDRRRKASLATYGVGLAGLAAVALFVAGLPLLSMTVIAGSTLSGLALAARTGDVRTPPDAISPLDVRGTYMAILTALEEVELAAQRTSRLGSSVGAVLERCRAAATLCGRMALLANPLQRYLDSHDRERIANEQRRLRARAETTSDDQIVGAFSRATAARTHQLDTFDQILAMRERIGARLELVLAGLEAFAAMIIKLDVTDQEQILLAGESVTEDIDGVDEELAALESALAVDLPA